MEYIEEIINPKTGYLKYPEDEDAELEEKLKKAYQKDSYASPLWTYDDWTGTKYVRECYGKNCPPHPSYMQVSEPMDTEEDKDEDDSL